MSDPSEEQAPAPMIGKYGIQLNRSYGGSEVVKMLDQLDADYRLKMQVLKDQRNKSQDEAADTMADNLKLEAQLNHDGQQLSGLKQIVNKLREEAASRVPGPAKDDAEEGETKEPVNRHDRRYLKAAQRKVPAPRPSLPEKYPEVPVDAPEEEDTEMGPA
jgi:hypothetical protein